MGFTGRRAREPRQWNRQSRNRCWCRCRPSAVSPATGRNRQNRRCPCRVSGATCGIAGIVSGVLLSPAAFPVSPVLFPPSAALSAFISGIFFLHPPRYPRHLVLLFPPSAALSAASHYLSCIIALPAVSPVSFTIAALPAASYCSCVAALPRHRYCFLRPPHHPSHPGINRRRSSSIHLRPYFTVTLLCAAGLRPPRPGTGLRPRQARPQFSPEAFAPEECPPPLPAASPDPWRPIRAGRVGIRGLLGVGLSGDLHVLPVADRGDFRS